MAGRHCQIRLSHARGPWKRKKRKEWKDEKQNGGEKGKKEGGRKGGKGRRAEG